MTFRPLGRGAGWVLAPLVLAACSGSGSSGTGPAAGARPEIRDLRIGTSVDGVVEVTVEFTDPDSQPDSVGLTIETSRDAGRTWQASRLVASEPVARRETASTGDGATVVLRWDTVADLGFRPRADVRVRASARDAGGAGATFVVDVPPLESRRTALRRVRHHMIHYGTFDAAAIRKAERHDLVVLHPSNGRVEIATIRDIQDGIDPRDPADDVLVFGYISVGEDLRTIGLTYEQMRNDPRFVGDGSGPRVDPRGPDADGQSLAGVDPLGDPSPGGGGFASWYLDDNSVDRDPADIGDGLPDKNSVFGGCFVNAGDPLWFDTLDVMRIDGVDGQPGMRELLSADHGRGYDLDGLFLDTIDTAAPNSYTDANSDNQSEFEWTAPGFTAFMQRLEQRYPDRLVLQNRGMFFFDPRLPHYAVTSRPHVDVVLIESYRLDSNTNEGFHPYFFPDNKHNFAPKLNAEASRPDGFVILSLGYAEGPGIAHGTLRGESTAGLDTLLEDIREAQDLAGFHHYLTDAGLTYANTFVRDRPEAIDVTPPRWSSTYNANVFPWPRPPEAPEPRVGIRRAEAGPNCVTVSWDVAMDRNRVGYALYTSTAPFDFAADPLLRRAVRTVLIPDVGRGYANGPSPDTFPFEFELTGLENERTYWFAIRAFDAAGNEDDNQVVLAATPAPPVQIRIDGDFSEWARLPVLHTDPLDAPGSAGADWRDLQVHDDGEFLYVRFTSAHPFNLDGSPTYGFSRTFLFIDVDANPTTGWPVGSVGSELMVAGDALFAQTATTFNAGWLANLAILPTTGVVECEFAVPLAEVRRIAPNARTLRLHFVNDEVPDYAPNATFLPYTLR